MRRGQDYSPISPSKLSSTSFRNFNLYHKYENMSLMNKLPGDSYEDLFRSKLVLNDPFVSLEAKNAQDKYAELEKHVRELYEEFKLHCIPGEVRDMIPEPKDADSDLVEVAKAIKGILQLLQKTLKEQEQVNLLNVENRKDIDYEMLLQKAEGDIKKHIRTHQQLKFVIETMQAKIEEYDSDKGIFLQNAKSVFKDAKSDNKTLIDMIRQKDTEIHILNAKMKQKDETIKSHEERLLSIPILEHKIKGLKDSHSKEKELVKQYYQQEFANLTKEVQHIHKVLSTNMNLDERLKMLEQELNTYKNFNVKKLQSLEDKLSQFDSHHEKIENVLSQAVSLHEGLDPTDIKSTILAAVSPTRAPVKIHNRPRNLLQNKSVSSLHKALEEKHTIHKQRLVKKKSEVSDEIKMLSVSRIQDLTQEIADPHQDFHRSTSPKKFDSYFIALKRKLDKRLSQINNKEREFLKSINSQTAEIPARETRTRQAVSRVVVKRLNDESMHDHRPAFLSPKSVQSKTNTNRASSVQPKV